MMGRFYVTMGISLAAAIAGLLILFVDF